MKQTTRDVNNAEARTARAERRAFVRYPVVLDATLAATDGQTVACAVRDFCGGGMLLQFKQQAAKAPRFSFTQDDEVTLSCVVPESDGNKILQFQARVARNVQDGIGLAFINPKRESLQILQQYALQVSSENNRHKNSGQSSVKGNESVLLGRRFNDIVAGCGRIVQDTIDSLLKQLGANLVSRLFELSRDSKNPELQNAFFSASDELKNDQDQFLSAIRLNLKERLLAVTGNSFDPKRLREQRSEDPALEEMTLIGDEDLGAWLAVSDVTSKVEEKYKESLSTLEERLSVLFGVHVSHGNNPYGPALFAESFQAGLARFKFKESVNMACYAVLKEILINILSDLYDKLNDILIQYGILPKLKYRLIHRSSSPKEKTGLADIPPMSAPEPHSCEEAGNSDLLADQVDASAGDAAEASAVKKPSKSRQDKVTRRPAPQHEAPPDLCQVVQDVRALRRDIFLHGSHNSSPSYLNLAGSGPADQNPAGVYSTSELVAAIAELQTDPESYASTGDHLTHMKSRVLDALVVRSRDNGGKGLNPRDSNVLEVTGDLLGAMLSDPLVAESVKPWLKQLELPVLKLALRDPSLFFDQSHVARQVVNNIAQLEFYRQENATSRQNSISSAIENLLEKIARERSDGVEIFTEIQAKLNKLIKIQDKAYSDNLRDVVKTCQENLPIPEVCDFESAFDGDISDSEMRKWMMFVSRLREGDDVLYSFRDSIPQRLRVAWIDKQRTVYVFVNLQGIKEKVLSAADMARMMRMGVLEPQANAADPAMDRAQYVIMQNLYEQVVHESTHDSLTGLINRREFGRHLGVAAASAKRNDLRHVLVFIDVDKFNVVNHNCGYGGGDKLLQDLVGIFKNDLNGKGEIARLGSDEYGILIEECTLDDALAITEQLIESVANYALEWGGNTYSVSLSIGVVPINARSGGEDELLQAAESSCKIAKDAGGNRLQVFHAGHSRIGHQNELMKWAEKIDKMLGDDSLEIRCQRIEPIDSNSSLRPHYEILLGVKDEQGNVGLPGEFIKAAEWYNKMSAVDRQVILKTLSWMESNPGSIEKIAGFTINLSGQSLNEEGFAEFILEQLEAVSVPRDKICFEVTETVGITNLSDVTLIIEKIKDAGCRFALDDFGSGMSSYGYLKNLPVDVVKIDGAFVKELVADSSDYAVVKSITEIAHFMKKRVVAEFVETSGTLDLLREIGVDYAQGYLIDKPGSLDRLVNTNYLH